jgi:hypothetical protein
MSYYTKRFKKPFWLRFYLKMTDDNLLERLRKRKQQAQGAGQRSTSNDANNHADQNAPAQNAPAQNSPPLQRAPVERDRYPELVLANGKIFVPIIFGPRYSFDAFQETLSHGLIVPLAEDLLDLIEIAWQRPFEQIQNMILNPKNRYWCGNGLFFSRKGIYVIDNPEINLDNLEAINNSASDEISSEPGNASKNSDSNPNSGIDLNFCGMAASEENLEAKLSRSHKNIGLSDDGALRFAPYQMIGEGEQTSKEIEQNGFIMALFGVHNVQRVAQMVRDNYSDKSIIQVLNYQMLWTCREKTGFVSVGTDYFKDIKGFDTKGKYLKIFGDNPVHRWNILGHNGHVIGMRPYRAKPVRKFSFAQ